MLKFIKRYPLTIIVIIAIFYLSFFTPPKLTDVEVPFYDKWGHLCMYGGLASVIWYEYLRANRKHFITEKIISYAFIFPVFLGGAIELGQKYLTTNREGDWLDFAANSLGVILAWLVGYYILRPFFITPEKPENGKK